MDPTMQWGMNQPLQNIQQISAGNPPMPPNTQIPSVSHVNTQPPAVNSQVREDTVAVSFLAMAEQFRGSTPPMYKAAAKCLYAATKTSASPRIKGHIHFQLGKLLFNYTKNVTRAKGELETAHTIFKELGATFEEKRLQCACMIAECSLVLNDTESILHLLQKEALHTRKHPKIHGKALMLTIEALTKTNPLMALEVSEMGQRYFKELKERTAECYFQLVKSLLYARTPEKEEELGTSVTELGVILNQIQQVPNINDMRAFCYTIQLSYFLSTGMILHSKKCLRELQIIVQSKGQEEESAAVDPVCSFNWLRREILTGLTYVITALSSIQSGQFEKAERYYNHAMSHLGEVNATMKTPAKWGICERRDERLLAQLHFALHDGMAQMYLAKARPDKVFEMGNQMHKALRVLPNDLRSFEGQLHFIMGLYLDYMDMGEAAVEQYKAVFSTTDDYNLEVLAKLSLCMLYLRKGREEEYYEYFESVRHDKIKKASMNCQALSYFVAALHAYIHGRIAECKNNAVEAVTQCQNKDILRPQAMSMLLISRAFDCKDAEAIAAGKEWAQLANDLNLQAWAYQMIMEHLNQRVRDENTKPKENTRQFAETLAQIDKQIENNRQVAAELQLPKFAMMTDYSTELNISQWSSDVI